MSDDMKIDPEKIYTISTAGRLLSVSPSTLRDLERRGKAACTRTLGGQRRFAGSELLRLREKSIGVPLKKSGPTSTPGAATTEDAKARQAWLGPLIARAQRELPVDTPAAIRLRLGADLERALGNLGPASPIGDVDLLVKRLIDRARLQAQQAQEEAQRRDIKAQLLDYAQAHLRRSIDGLPRRVVGAPGSLKRRHVRATLRDQLRDRLQKRLKGDEDWHQVCDLVDEFVAAWYVGQPPGLRIPETVKILAAGVTGLVGGAAAAAALDPRIRAKIQAEAAKLKDPFLLLAVYLLKRVPTPPPSASSPPNPASQANTPPRSGPATGIVGLRTYSYRRTPRPFRPGTPGTQPAAEEGSTASDAEAGHAAAASRDGTPHESPGPSIPPA